MENEALGMKDSDGISRSLRPSYHWVDQSRGKSIGTKVRWKIQYF